MQSLTFGFSVESLILLKPRRASISKPSSFDPMRVSVSPSSSSSPKPRHHNDVTVAVSVSAFLPRRSWSLCMCPTSSPSEFRPCSSVPSASSVNEAANRFDVTASVDSNSSGAGDDAADGFEVRARAVSNSFTKTLVLGSLFGLWCLYNIYFNKQVSKIYQSPVCVIVAFLLFSVGLCKTPEVCGLQLAAILLLVLVPFTNMSPGEAAVSFTDHTIKLWSCSPQLSSLLCFWGRCLLFEWLLPGYQLLVEWRWLRSLRPLLIGFLYEIVEGIACSFVFNNRWWSS